MMKTAPKDNVHTHDRHVRETDAGASGHRTPHTCLTAIASAVLLVFGTASAWAEPVALAPGTRVTVTDGQLGEQVTPVMEPRKSSPVAPTATGTPALAGKARLKVSGTLFPADGLFPQSGFTGASFQVLANGLDAQDNSQYQWHSNQTWVRVGKDGTVTFIDMPTAATRTVTLTATPASGGTPFATTFSVGRWFINAKTETMTLPAAEAWCLSRGNGFALPETVVMTTATDSTPAPRTANGALWNEWGPMALYRSGWQLGNYWAGTAQGEKRDMVGLVNGNVFGVLDSSQYLVSCVRGLQ